MNERGLFPPSFPAGMHPDASRTESAPASVMFPNSLSLGRSYIVRFRSFQQNQHLHCLASTYRALNLSPEVSSRGDITRAQLRLVAIVELLPLDEPASIVAPLLASQQRDSA
jgi:hypothetical protein